VIEVQHLTKRYGRFVAVSDVCFRVPAGSAVALWGPNGAGKTTTLRCVLGLVSFEGRITVDGLDVRRQGREVRRRIGYVPQHLALYDMTVSQILSFYCGLRKVPPERAHERLEWVGLGGIGSRPAGTLSAGMRQRLAVALALVADPPVLVLDEPTANLDARARRDLLDLLVALRRKGHTILFASHRPGEVLDLADQVIVMEDGKVKASGPPQALARLDRSGVGVVDFEPEGMPWTSPRLA